MGPARSSAQRPSGWITGRAARTAKSVDVTVSMDTIEDHRQGTRDPVSRGMRCDIKPHWSTLAQGDVDQLRVFAKQIENQYLVVDQEGIPKSIALTLRQKCPNALAMSSTHANGIITLVYNLNREDPHDPNSIYGAIDQMPYAMAFLPNGGASSTLLVDHGDWPGRTQYMTSTGLVGIMATILPPSNAGPLTDILGTSNGEALLQVYLSMKSENQI